MNYELITWLEEQYQKTVDKPNARFDMPSAVFVNYVRLVHEHSGFVQHSLQHAPFGFHEFLDHVGRLWAKCDLIYDDVPGLARKALFMYGGGDIDEGNEHIPGVVAATLAFELVNTSIIGQKPERKWDAMNRISFDTVNPSSMSVVMRMLLSYLEELHEEGRIGKDEYMDSIGDMADAIYDTLCSNDAHSYAALLGFSWIIHEMDSEWRRFADTPGWKLPAAAYMTTLNGLYGCLEDPDISWIPHDYQNAYSEASDPDIVRIFESRIDDLRALVKSAMTDALNALADKVRSGELDYKDALDDYLYPESEHIVGAFDIAISMSDGLSATQSVRRRRPRM